jgi:hypothetical protein
LTAYGVLPLVEIIDDEADEIAADASRPRPWWLTAALVGVALGSIIGAALLPLPTTRPSAAVPPLSTRNTTPVPLSAPGPSCPECRAIHWTQPVDVPLLPEEERVIRALIGENITGGQVDRSRYDHVLGPQVPGRLFDIPDHGAADVLFLDVPRDIRACPTSSAVGPVDYKISVNGDEALRIDAVAPVAFLLNDQFFVIAWDESAASLLQMDLVLSRVSC